MRRTIFILSVAFSFPAIALAQHPGGVATSGMHFSAAPAMMAPRVASVRPMGSARPGGVRSGTRSAVAPKTVRHTGWNQGTHRNIATNPDPVFPNGYNFAFNGYPVPGLGFDYPHYFATHPNAGFCNRCSGFGSGFVVPFVDGGIYMPAPYGEEGAPQPAEETETAEQPPQAEQPAPQEPAYYPPPRAKSQSVPAQQEYVFVKRDGTLIFAVAYTWINDRLQYVTEEGIRRTVPRNSLDLDATQQFNDQRGVPIHFPA